MKRMFSVITVVLAVFTVGSRAAAEGAYFGIRGEEFLVYAFNSTNINSGAATAPFLPLFGVQGGYDFGSQSDPGFGVRAPLSSVVVMNHIAIDALLRIPNDASGNGFYLGAGADALILFVQSASGGTTVWLGAHAVVGYRFPVAAASGFVEFWPGFLSAEGNSIYHAGLALGFDFRL
jgi:hypothetical protein